MSDSRNLLDISGEIKDKIFELDSNFKFSPGIDQTKLDKAFRKINFDPPTELLELYSWHDGSFDIELLPGSTFWPFECGISDFERLSDLYSDSGEPLWKSFKFLSDFSDGGYSITESEDGGRIVQRCIHASWEVDFRSLASLLEFSLECYTCGVFSIVDGAIEPEFELYEELAEARISEP